MGPGRWQWATARGGVAVFGPTVEWLGRRTEDRPANRWYRLGCGSSFCEFEEARHHLGEQLGPEVKVMDRRERASCGRTRWSYFHLTCNFAHGTL